MDQDPLEGARTWDILDRHLPRPPGVVLDVGGAAGAYAFGLAERGYAVHLVDPVPLHIQQALEASAARATGRLAGAALGDARALDRPDASVDVVLMLGPLYHLLETADRLAALVEARRVLKPGGWLFAAAISRFASLLDGLRGELFDQPLFPPIIEHDLATGRHRNDTGFPQFFTTAFFHHPDELRAEVTEAGFALEGVLAVEGPAGLMPDLRKRWDDPAQRQTLLRFLRMIEREPVLSGATFHLVAVARRP
ncbi:MAG TPA: methyltransferase domain-containing protein [Vicinamibacteria bacterium]|nr:methyltransferase domain-containing protein [Vicinamibacteria bacterium]